MKLAGFSGKMGHGKDMAAEMLQYIQYRENIKNGIIDHDPIISSFSEWESEFSSDLHRLFSGIQIQKFGGKLKDMICILLNCTREQLEDREFKEKELGEEWDRYRLDSMYWPETMDSESNEYYEEHMYFATEKEAIEYGEKHSKLYTVPDDIRQYGMSGEWSYDIEKEKLTPRLLLQLMGTECGRKILHPNIWVNSTLEPYIKQKNDTETENKYNDWVISDVRFPNEVNAIEKLDGIVIRIERDSVVPSENEHESETALDDYPFKYVLKNNGTKEELLEKIYKIYKNKYQ